MPYLIGLLAVLGAVGTFIIRANYAASAANELHGEARTLLRRLGLTKTTRSPLELVEDPREAAVTLMAIMAGLRGAPSAAALKAIEVQAHHVFGPQNVTEVVALGRWLAGQTHDPEQAQRRLLGVLRRSLGPTERADLFAMLDAVAHADGAPTPEQTAFSASLRARLQVPA